MLICMSKGHGVDSLDCMGGSIDPEALDHEQQGGHHEQPMSIGVASSSGTQ
jgi:hypothetical protein